MNCSRGHANQSNAAFCVVCGEQLGVAAAPPATPMAPPVAPPPIYPPAQPPTPTYGTPAYANTGYQQQPPVYPNAGYGAPMYGGVMAPQNGKGTAALVLGILGLFLFPVIFSVLAIILGVQGKNLADRGLATNRGAAQAGFVLGIIGLVIGFFIFLFLLGA